MRGGVLVLPGGERRADLLVDGGRIARVVDAGDGASDDELDARGLVVLPGAVDAHVHFNEPGRAEWEGWERGTRGAAAGGVTTVCDMPLNSIPPTTTVAALDAKRAAAERAAHVDFALWGGLVPGADVGGVLARGAVGSKAFLCDSGVPEFPPVAADDVARAPGLVAVHAEDPSALVERALTWERARPPEAEVRAVASLARAGARAHVVHVSAAAALDALGPGMTAETCPHYLTFTSEDVERAGPVLKCAPPIRSAAERERLWAAVLTGRVLLIASDHSPAAADRKRGSMWEAWGGIAGVQSLLPALLTEGVARRGLPLARLADLVATAPARLLGLRAKGSIAPGMDADLALVDTSREWTLDAASLETRSGLSPYVGRTFTGAVVATVVRGRVVYRDGAFPAGIGYGRFVARYS
ncbi:MAG TPA: allantoinase AllB [Candidatus Limnocylindria bacterium]|nr:allantoinase AllB [Candidatus Limnocylindria bacterium]